jgi:hypothetical protein
MMKFLSPTLVTRAVVVLVLLVMISSCATQKEVSLPAVHPPSRPEVHGPQPPAPAPKLRVSLQCREDTKKVFNRCGIESLPFERIAFYDMDGDGTQELVAGGKDGALRLYKNYGTLINPEWRLQENYFQGISAGAFSSPAVGDIDGDGRPEIAVGTGGFSSDSGRVIVFKNAGTAAEPRWEKIEMPEIRVGNDATPSFLAMGGRGRPDLLVGNSEGRLFLYRNRSGKGRVSFRRDGSYFRGVRLGMYSATAAFAAGGKVHVIVGNDMGKLYLFESSSGSKGDWSRTTLGIFTTGFASPSFVRSSDGGSADLVVSDASGRLRYFRNRKGNFRDWEESDALFSGRVLPGPACTPVMEAEGDRRFMTSGNVYGEMKLFDFDAPVDGVVPAERQDFFKGIKLPGFSKGLLAEWRGALILVTGQQDGLIRAFANSGSWERPVWSEQNNFFAGLPKMLHASPAVFDLDGDGRWELIVGDAEGRVQGFRYEPGPDGNQSWKRIEGVFDRVKVGRYASPALFRDAGMTYLLVGRQDGRIALFTAEGSPPETGVFQPDGLLGGIVVKGHSSPSAVERSGRIEIAVGDYDGNLRHFSCQKAFVPAEEK